MSAPKPGRSTASAVQPARFSVSARPRISAGVPPKPWVNSTAGFPPCSLKAECSGPPKTSRGGMAASFAGTAAACSKSNRKRKLPWTTMPQPLPAANGSLDPRVNARTSPPAMYRTSRPVLIHSSRRRLRASRSATPGPLSPAARRLREERLPRRAIAASITPQTTACNPNPRQNASPASIRRHPAAMLNVDHNSKRRDRASWKSQIMV